MSSPAGQALLQGGKRSTYTGRELRHKPVWLGSEEPGSRVMAKGLTISASLGQQAIFEDVLVRQGLYACDSVAARMFSKQVGESFLRLQVVLHRRTLADFEHCRDFSALSLEYRKQTGFLGQAGDAN